MQRLGGVVWPALIVGLLVFFVAHIAFGGVFSLTEIWSGLASGPGDSAAQTVVWDIRFPRAATAAFVGANLALVGAAFQSLFRNPLADPFIIGVSSAAAVGGAFATFAGIGSAAYGLGAVGSAFATAVLGLLLVLRIAGHGEMVTSRVLIAGAAVGSFLWALVTFILARAGQDAGKILDWLLGSLVGMDWPRALIVSASAIVGFLVLQLNSRRLTVFSVGEVSAATLGVDVRRLKWTILLCGTGMAAATVSCVGIVGFVGLFTPHMARRLVGPDLRRLLPASALLGASSVLFADLLAQRVVPGGLNIGVVTALLCAPFLVVLMRRNP